MVFLLLKLAMSKVSLTDTPTLVCKNLFGLTQGIKLLLLSHENHSERYSTQDQPCLEKGFLAV